MGKIDRVGPRSGCCTNIINTYTNMPSGFRLYQADARERIAHDLKNRGIYSNETLVSELQKRWRVLPECSKETWTKKAAGK